MKFQFAHVGDVHLGSYQGKVEAGGYNSRFLDFVKTYNQTIDIIIEKKIPLTLFAGDMFRSKNPSPEELNEFAKGLMRLLNENIVVIICLGNHDLYLADNRTHSFGVIQTILSSHKNFIISKQPEIIDVDIPGQGKVQVQTGPYPIRSTLRLDTNQQVSKYVEDKIEELYASRDKKAPLIFLGHFTLSKATVGDEQRYVDKFSEPVINTDIFKGKDYVYVGMGHIHTYQQLMSNPPVIYAGSNNRVDFNEAKEDKGFLVVDLVKNKTKYEVEYEFIKVDARKFIDLRYDLEKHLDPQDYILKDLKSRKKELADSIVRLEVILSGDNERKYNSKEVVDVLNEMSYWIHGAPNIAVKRNNIQRTNAGFKESMNASQSLNHYVTVNKVRHEELFLQLGQEIIKKHNEEVAKS